MTFRVAVGLLQNYWWSTPRALRVFHERLNALGWVRGQTLALEYRFYEDRPERLPELAAELVRERVDVIVAAAVPEAKAAQAASATLPVIFLTQSDPVQAGLVASLAQPGGNLTGVSYPSSTGYAGKRLELLTEAAPLITRVAVLIEAATGPVWNELELAARTRGVELLPLELHSRAEREGALATGAAAGAQAILQADSISTDFDGYSAISAVARQHRLPVVYNGYLLGGLLAYAPSFLALWTRGAEYVDRVLRGAKPVQTPVDLVKEYDLHVNLWIARELGLTIPPSLLARATEVSQPGSNLPVQAR